MEIQADESLIINDIEMSKTTVTIDGKEVVLGKPVAHKFGRCDIKKVKKMICNGKEIIRNGKVLVKCDKCEGCPMLKTTTAFIHTGINVGKRKTIYYCGKNEVYSEELKALKKSKIKSKREIEERRAYECLEERFKRRREKYITEETIKECIDDIQNCLNSEYGTYNEYGHKVVMLENIRITKNDYGYKLTHDGRLGDDGWYNKVRIHKKCDISKLRRALELKFNHRVEME